MYGITYKRNGKWHYQINESIEDGKTKRTVRVLDALNKAEAERELQNAIFVLRNKKK